MSESIEDINQIWETKQKKLGPCKTYKTCSLMPSLTVLPSDWSYLNFNYFKEWLLREAKVFTQSLFTVASED